MFQESIIFFKYSIVVCEFSLLLYERFINYKNKSIFYYFLTLEILQIYINIHNSVKDYWHSEGTFKIRRMN